MTTSPDFIALDMNNTPAVPAPVSDDSWSLDMSGPIASNLPAPTPAAVSLTDTLASMAAAPILPDTPARAPRTRRIGASQSADAIAKATAEARAAGQRLAGYNGRIVEPGTTGLGTVIAFGFADRERDLVSDRDRQVLIRWTTIEQTLVQAGFSSDVLGKPVSDVAHLGQATKILNHSGYIARAMRGNRGAWIVGRIDTSAKSDVLGYRDCTITLDKATGNLTLSDPTHGPALQVQREYQNRRESVLIESSDLRARIERTLAADFGARSTDLGLYVSPFHTDNAMRLIVALRPVAGRKIYAWTHTDRESIAEALADSFSADLARLERSIEGKSGDLKKIAGASLVEWCERLKSELVGLAAILGTDATEGYKLRLGVADELILGSLDLTAARFSMLDL